MSKFNIGDKVVFTNAEKHEKLKKVYPAVGAVGTVRTVKETKENLLVDWGDAKDVAISYDNTKSWWCDENDVEPYTCDKCEPTDDEVWEMLKPKMRQFVRDVADIDIYSPTVKKMVVTAYRSGYGRAIKGRDFMIKTKVDEKPSIEKSIDDVLGDKMIIAIYTGLDNSYLVSKFSHALHSEQGMEIHGDIVYNSDGGAWANGYDVISDPDLEMYVAVPFSEMVGRFRSDSVKALYCGGEYRIKSWAIGEFSGIMRFGNKTDVAMTFKCEGSNSQFYSEIHNPDFKALVPIRDYFNHEGVNV